MKAYHSVYECWDDKGFPVADDALTQQQAEQQCQRLLPVGDVQWHGAPSKTNTFITKAIDVGVACSDPDKHVIRDAYLAGCDDNTQEQSRECLSSQRRWEAKKRKGCIAPTVTQFTPSYSSQGELLKAPICVGTTTWNYSKDDENTSGLTYVACFAKDQCESCPCQGEDDGSCYNPKTRECVNSYTGGMACPVGTVSTKDCVGTGKTQQVCSRFGTKLLCPGAEECMSGEYALHPQQVLHT